MEESESVSKEEPTRQGLSGFAAVAAHERIMASMLQSAEKILRLIQAGQYDAAQALMTGEAWYLNAADTTEETGEQTRADH